MKLNKVRFERKSRKNPNNGVVFQTKLELGKTVR